MSIANLVRYQKKNPPLCLTFASRMMMPPLIYLMTMPSYGHIDIPILERKIWSWRALFQYLVGSNIDTEVQSIIGMIRYQPVLYEVSPWSYGGSPYSLWGSPQSLEAHHEALDAHPGSLGCSRWSLRYSPWSHEGTPCNCVAHSRALGANHGAEGALKP